MRTATTLAAIALLRESVDCLVEHRTWRVFRKRIREDFSSARNRLKRLDAETAHSELPGSRTYDSEAELHYHHGMRKVAPLPVKLKHTVKRAVTSNDKNQLRGAAVLSYNQGFIGLANHLARKASKLVKPVKRRLLQVQVN